MIWTGERARQQHLLVAEMYQTADGVPSERRAAIAGGLPGADKSAALDRAGLDQARYLTVSIDAILDRMAAADLIPEASTPRPAPATRAAPATPRPPRPAATSRHPRGRRPGDQRPSDQRTAG